MGARQRRPSGNEAEPVSPRVNPIDHSGDEISSPSDEMAPWMKSNDDDNAVDAPAQRSTLSALADLLTGSKKTHRRGTLVLEGHAGEIHSLAVLDDGRGLASVSDDKVIIWRVAEGKPITKLEGHTESIFCLAALDSARLASGSVDKTIIIWNLADGKQLAKLVGHRGEVNCLAALDCDRLASGSQDASIIIWNLADGKQLAKLSGHSETVLSLLVLDDGRIASGGGTDGDGEVFIWNLADTRQPQAKLRGHEAYVTCLAALDGERLASGSGDYFVIIWNLADGTQISRLIGHTSNVRALAVLDDGRLASSSMDKSVIIWSVENREVLVKLRGHSSPVWCLAALDGGQLASGDLDGSLRIRPVLHSAAYKFAACSSAFEFEELARSCRQQDCLGDLFEAAAVQQHGEKIGGLPASPAVMTQAHVLDAIAKVVNDEEDAPRERSIDSLAPRVLGLVGDESLLSDMERLGASNASIQELAPSPLFRVVLDAMYVAGPRAVLYLEMILFIALMFCFGRIAGLLVLGWTEYYRAEKIFLLSCGFVILVWFSWRELYQMLSARRIELALPENPLRDDDQGGVQTSVRDRSSTLSHQTSVRDRLTEYQWKVDGFKRYALLIPRYALLCLVCLVQLPIFLVTKKSEEWWKPRTLPEDWFNAMGCEHPILDLRSPTAKHIIHDPLTFIGVPRAWRRDYWNLVDAATIGCTWASFVRAALPGGRLSVNLAAITSLLLWVKFLQFVKDFSLRFSKFVMMFERVVTDLYIFVAFFFIILLMFATTFYLYLGTKTRSDIGYHDDGEPTHYSTFPKTLFSLYLLGLLGDFDLDTFDNRALRFILVLFVFIVAVVLLNVLIAIVSKSHDDITGKIAAGLFYRSRLEYITETTPVARLLPSWLRREEDGDSIKERLREALAQHKDASEADHVRESEERTKQELADVKRELAAMAATQQIILAKLQTILDDKQP